MCNKFPESLICIWIENGVLESGVYPKLQLGKFINQPELLRLINIYDSEILCRERPAEVHRVSIDGAVFMIHPFI